MNIPLRHLHEQHTYRLILFFVIYRHTGGYSGVSGGYSYWRSQSELATDLKQSGEILRNRLETSLGGPLWNFDDYQIDRTLDSEMLSPQIQRIVIENNDRLVAEGVIEMMPDGSNDWRSCLPKRKTRRNSIRGFRE